MTQNRNDQNPDHGKNHDPAIRVGDWVRVEEMESLGLGQVVSVDARRKRARVRVSDHEWVLPLSRLSAEAPPPESAPRKDDAWRLQTRGPVAYEIDLHGSRVEEALAEVDRALDQAVANHLDRLKIIHGHGTGALRKSIRELLSRHPHVRAYRFGEPHEGGLACTVAELKSP